jgi:hypothetical protein
MRLSRTTHPGARIGRDLGRVASDLEMDRVLMELQSSPEQHQALDALLAEQHDPSSPRYQRWLTPEEFGEMFGPSQADVDAVTQWLESKLKMPGSAPFRMMVVLFPGNPNVERNVVTSLILILLRPAIATWFRRAPTQPTGWIFRTSTS